MLEWLRRAVGILQTSRMVYVSLFCVYIASDEGLSSLIHASLTKSCQSLCLHDLIRNLISSCSSDPYLFAQT